MSTLERIWKCPGCGAPLSPSRFARSATCVYCHAVVQIDEASVSAARFREAYRRWTTPDPASTQSWFTLGHDHWAELALVAHGEIADVFLVQRARSPRQRALLKVLRSADDAPMLDAEAAALAVLQASTAPGAAAFAPRVPLLLARGVLGKGPQAGARATLFHLASGFEHTCEAVRAAYPRGVDGRVAVWMWRRVLEVLSFAHRSGIVHGAVLPQHLLIERGEHGVRLVGYGCAVKAGGALAAVVARHERLYPARLLATQRLAPEHDVQMSARSIGFVLGADDDGHVPPAVPAPLRALVEAVGRGEGAGDAWSVRERIGAVAASLYGPPSFNPLVMPEPQA